MACLGVHFALTEEQAHRLLRAANEGGDDAVLAVVEEIEDEWNEDYLQETDKSWDAIHRCLSDGTLNPEGGSYPLKMCIFGGRHLCFSGNYYVVYIAPNEVQDVARALETVSEEWAKHRYWSVPFPDYQDEKSDEDFEYTWEYLDSLRHFFRKAALANRSVIFTVDQ